MNKFSKEELLTVLKFTESLADVTTGRVPDSGTASGTSLNFADVKVTDSNRDSVLREAEEEARRYAAKRNANKRHHSDFGASDAERGIAADTKQWLERRRRRGHKV